MAQSSIEMPDPASSVTLVNDPNEKAAPYKGSAILTVTNRTDQPLSCRLEAMAVNDAQASWFNVRGEPERGFKASETQKVTVDIAAPSDAKDGDNYGFRLRGYNINRLSDAAESNLFTVVVPTTKRAERHRWIPWAIAAGLLLLVGGFATWKLWPKPPAMPNVADGSLIYSDAEKVIAEALARTGQEGVVVSKSTGEPTGKVPETVIAQSPRAGEPLPRDNGKVTLVVDPGVRVPRVETRVWDAETQALLADFEPKISKILYRQYKDRTVLLSDPGPGAQVAKGSVVSLVIGRTCASAAVCAALDFRQSLPPLTHAPVQ